MNVIRGLRRFLIVEGVIFVPLIALAWVRGWTRWGIGNGVYVTGGLVFVLGLFSFGGASAYAPRGGGRAFWDAMSRQKGGINETMRTQIKESQTVSPTAVVLTAGGAIALGVAYLLQLGAKR